MMKSLGAGKMIDYTKEDYTQSGESYDIVFDTVIKINKSKSSKVLTRDGKFVSAGDPIKTTIEDMELISKLVEEGHIKPVMDRVYAFDQVVEGHRYVEQGHKKGNVVVVIPPIKQ